MSINMYLNNMKLWLKKKNEVIIADDVLCLVSTIHLQTNHKSTNEQLKDIYLSNYLFIYPSLTVFLWLFFIVY